MITGIGVTVETEQKSAGQPLSEIAGPVIIKRSPTAAAETCRLTFPSSDEGSDQRVVLLCRGSEPS